MNLPTVEARFGRELLESNGEHGTIVVGSRLAAIVYAYLKSLPIVVPEPDLYSPFSFLEPDLSLDKIGMQNQTTRLRTPQGVIDVGMNKSELVSALLFALSLSGKLLYAGCDVRATDGNLEVSCEDRIDTLEASRYVFFDDVRIAGLDGQVPVANPKAMVVDWFIQREPKKSIALDLAPFETNYVNRIFFYLRENKNAKYEDVAVVSFLTAKERASFDYSQTAVRFAVEEYLTQSLDVRVNLKNDGREEFKSSFDDYSFLNSKMLFDRRDLSDVLREEKIPAYRDVLELMHDSGWNTES